MSVPMNQERVTELLGLHADLEAAARRVDAMLFANDVVLYQEVRAVAMRTALAALDAARSSEQPAIAQTCATCREGDNIGKAAAGNDIWMCNGPCYGARLVMPFGCTDWEEDYRRNPCPQPQTIDTDAKA